MNVIVEWPGLNQSMIGHYEHDELRLHGEIIVQRLADKTGLPLDGEASASRPPRTTATPPIRPRRGGQ